MSDNWERQEWRAARDRPLYPEQFPPDDWPDRRDLHDLFGRDEQ